MYANEVECKNDVTKDSPIKKETVPAINIYVMKYFYKNLYFNRNYSVITFYFLN